MRPLKVLLHRVRVYLGVMVLKGYYTLLRAPELEPHHQMLFSVISRTSLFFGGGEEFLSLQENIVSIFQASQEQKFKVNKQHRLSTFLVSLFRLMSKNNTVNQLNDLNWKKTKPNSFCYICKSITVVSASMNISDFMKTGYLAYFQIRSILQNENTM